MLEHMYTHLQKMNVKHSFTAKWKLTQNGKRKYNGKYKWIMIVSENKITLSYWFSNIYRIKILDKNDIKSKQGKYCSSILSLCHYWGIGKVIIKDAGWNFYSNQ